MREQPRAVVLVVVDSLRSASLTALRPSLKFGFARLDRETTTFRHAHATECWTLPTHMSMFTGRLPSEHGAHFQTMAYRRAFPAAAELFARAGYHTEVVTRNSLFDGTVPGATRGFQVNTRILSNHRRTSPLLALSTLAKPRLRRQLRQSGFFHAAQREKRQFVDTLTRMGLPADASALEYALTRMGELRRRAKRHFVFLNLYDVHAPYCPSQDSPLRSFRSIAGWRENLALPFVLSKVSSHGYLRPAFRLSEYSRRMLVGRYHRAIELMDAKLGTFYDEAQRAGFLDDTVLIVTSDHGEAFGEHGLYFHDASVYDTHLHVPLWIRHPDVAPSVVDDVVSTQSLFGLLKAAAQGEGLEGTLLDPVTRSAQPVALAEHFHYPYTKGLLPQYTRNIAAAIVGRRKVIFRHEGLALCDLSVDPDEQWLSSGNLTEFAAACRRDGAPKPAIEAAVEHISRWMRRGLATPGGLAG